MIAEIEAERVETRRDEDPLRVEPRPGIGTTRFGGDVAERFADHRHFRARTEDRR